VGDEAIIPTCLFGVYIAANEAMSYTVTHISFISHIFSCHSKHFLFEPRKVTVQHYNPALTSSRYPFLYSPKVEFNNHSSKNKTPLIFI